MKNVNSLVAKIVRAFGPNELPYPKDEMIESKDWIGSEIAPQKILSEIELQNDFAKRMAENYYDDNDYDPSLVFVGWKEIEEEEMIDIAVLIRPHIPDSNFQPVVE